MITEAYIAGTVERAIFKEEDEYFILESSGDNGYRFFPINHFDLNSFTLATPEITHYNNIEWGTERLYDELNNDAEKHNALDLFLMGMDKSLSDDLRREAMELFLESFLTNSEIESFVRNRVFATKVPAEFDAVSAFQIADNIGNEILIRWYKNLSSANDIIIAVRDAWKKTLLNHVNQLDINLEILDKEFTDRGIFSDFVLALLSKNYGDFDHAIVVHADGLKNLGIGQPAVFLSSLRQLVYNDISITQENVIKIKFDDINKKDENVEAVNKQDFVSKFNKMIRDFRGKSHWVNKGKRGKRIKTILLSKFFKENNINEQVAWIKDRINERNIVVAENAILKLIEYQDLRSEPEHLCKSLCDIAECFQNANLIVRSDYIARKAVELYPDDPVPHSIIAENFRAIGRLEEALTTYEDIIRVFKNDVVSRSGKAETLRQMGRLDEALTVYEDTILDFKNDVVPRAGRAETLRQMGKLEEALTAYEDTILDFKNVAVPRAGKAETLRQMGKLEEALITYEDIIRVFKNDVVSRAGKAETLRQMGRLKEALTTYEDTILDFKNDVVPRNGKAETLRQMGRLEEAEAMYTKIINDFPYDCIAKRARFVLLIQIGKNLNELEKQIQVPNPQSHDDWILNHVHCMLLIKLNKLGEAICKLKHGVENIKDIEQHNYYINALSYAYIKKREFKDAVVQLKKEINPYPVFQVLVTHAYAADGNLQKSKMYFNSISKSQIKKIEDASKYLSDRYQLYEQTFFSSKSNENLDKEIEDLEFDLITESYLIAQRVKKPNLLAYYNKEPAYNIIYNY